MNSLYDTMLWFLIILAADVVAIALDKVWERYKSRKLDLGCDYCEKVLPLKETPDKKYFLCSKCMKAFLCEHYDYSEEQLRKFKFGYRRRRRS